MCLAPMADVTDSAFRRIVVKYGGLAHCSLGKGGPDVIFTEFVSCDGLCSEGKKNLLLNLKYTEKERPIVAQIFGAKPANFYQTAKIIKKLGFDGIDINMGCPHKHIERQSAGAALIKNPELAQEIIKETKRGAGNMPVSVKTRLGYNKIETTSWIKTLLESRPDAISIHWRTRKEMSKVGAHWEEAKKVIKLRDKYSPQIVIIGNGDVETLEQAHKLADKYGVDGIMIGRAVIGNPWFFNTPSLPPSLKLRRTNPTSFLEQEGGLEEKLKVMLEHAKLFEKIFKNKKSFLLMRKHMIKYIKGFDNVKKLRIELMKTKNAKEVEKVVTKYC